MDQLTKSPLQLVASIKAQAGSNPPAVERLVQQLHTDCGNDARLEIIPQGYVQGSNQKKFTLILVCKKQKLNALCTIDYLEVVDITSKRSGPFVSTLIELKTLRVEKEEATC